MQKVRCHQELNSQLQQIICNKFQVLLNLIKVLFHLSLTVLVYYRLSKIFSLREIPLKNDKFSIIRHKINVVFFNVCLQDSDLLWMIQVTFDNTTKLICFRSPLLTNSRLIFTKGYYNVLLHLVS